MNVSEERKITAGTISGATLKSIDIEPSIIIEGKSYTASEFNKAVEMLKQPQLNDNQQIVFEWLEEYYAKSQWPFPFYVLKHAANDMPANIFGFYDDFTMKEEI